MMKPAPYKNLARIAGFLFFVILLVGIFLRVRQYFSGRGLWEDEAHLALNFIYYGYAGLMHPLANFQSAPILFLFSVETFTKFFGFGELSLHAFPFIVSLLVYPLFYYVMVYLSKSRITALIAFFIYTVCATTVYFASELKPYTIDICVYVVMLYLLFTPASSVSKRRDLLLVLVGIIALLYSNGSFVVLFCIAAYKMWQWYLNKKVRTVDVRTFSAWAIVFLVNYFAFIHNHPYGPGMKSIWADKFLPANIFSKEFVDFMSIRIDEIFFTLILYYEKGFGFKYVTLLIFITGTINIFTSRKYYLLFFTWLPIIIALFLSVIKLYPFYYRFILYLLPAFVLLTALGAKAITLFIRERVHPVAAVIFIVYCGYCFTAVSMTRFPDLSRNIKPALVHINKDYPDTKIFITTPFTLYEYNYRAGYVSNGNYQPVQWSISPEEYYKSVDSQKGNYILLHSIDPAADGYGEVWQDLKEKKLVVNEFTYTTYVITELKPLPAIAKDTL